VSAPGCRFQHLAVCFQEVPRAEATGYSRSNRQQPILPSTATLSIGSRRRNLQQPCSTRAGVTCHPSCRCFSSVALRDVDSCAARVRAIPYPLGSFATCALRQSCTATASRKPSQMRNRLSTPVRGFPQGGSSSRHRCGSSRQRSRHQRRAIMVFKIDVPRIAAA